MKHTYFVTLLVGSVLCLVGGLLAPATALALPKKVIQPALLKAKPALTKKVTTDLDKKTQPVATSPKTMSPAAANKFASSLTVEMKEKEEDKSAFAATALISRSSSLIDHSDGSRSDDMDYAILPSYKTSFGSFSSKIVYSQNLRDDSPDESDINDITVTYAMKSIKWEWSPPYILTVTPTLTTVLPVSKASQKRDQLQTALISGVSVGIIPDGIAVAKDGFWNLAIGITAGRNFHQYEESVNGAVILNQYSSNQTLNLGYTYKQWNVGVEYIHKSRWSYKGNAKDSFELTEEIGYSINDNYSVALGHTNAQLSGLKANGSEPSFEFINKNDSAVYLQLAASF